MKSTPEITAARARALSILHPIHEIDSCLFAHYMWPASSSWRGRLPGRGAYLKARSFLRRLEADGLVASEDRGREKAYRVTHEGEALASLFPTTEVVTDTDPLEFGIGAPDMTLAV
jgi:hypothetical protein